MKDLQISTSRDVENQYFLWWLNVDILMMVLHRDVIPLLAFGKGHRDVIPYIAIFSLYLPLVKDIAMWSLYLHLVKDIAMWSLYLPLVKDIAMWSLYFGTGTRLDVDIYRPLDIRHLWFSIFKIFEDDLQNLQIHLQILGFEDLENVCFCVCYNYADAL